MNRRLVGRVAAGHGAGLQFAAIVVHAVVAVHRGLFGFCCRLSVLVGGDRAMVPRAADSRRNDHARDNRQLEKESRDQTQKRGPTAESAEVWLRFFGRPRHSNDNTSKMQN